jgi:hypothetical protein
LIKNFVIPAKVDITIAKLLKEVNAYYISNNSKEDPIHALRLNVDCVYEVNSLFSVGETLHDL